MTICRRDPDRGRGVIDFTLAAQLPLHSVGRSHSRFTREAIHQIGQLHQVGEPKKHPPIAHHEFRIWARKISPLRRDRPNNRVISLQQKALAMAIVSPADTRQLSSE